jgi:hypothetical protein
MTKRKQQTTAAFNLLFGGESEQQVITQTITEMYERSAEAKDMYLVVKIGSKGTKMNDLYNNTLWSEGKEITLAGKHRLAGARLRSITEAVKEKGLTGTFSVFNYAIEDADELTHEHSKLMLKLAKDLDFTVVAKVNLSEAELDKEINKLTKEYHKKAVDTGFVRDTGKSSYEFTEWKAPDTTGMDYQRRRLAIRENNEMVNALRLRYKKEQATYVADRLGKYIRKI